MSNRIDFEDFRSDAKSYFHMRGSYLRDAKYEMNAWLDAHDDIAVINVETIRDKSEAPDATEEILEVGIRVWYTQKS